MIEEGGEVEAESLDFIWPFFFPCPVLSGDAVLTTTKQLLSWDPSRGYSCTSYSRKDWAKAKPAMAPKTQ